MVFTALSDLRPGDWRAVICVRVCRKWEYRGGTDDGPIQHVDLVLLDEQGNSLYVEIPEPEIEAKSRLIEEDAIYVIGRFRVSNAKSTYRAVDAPYMVEFTLHTTISAARSGMPDFPKYAYKITPIDGLPAFAGDNRNFLDTIGTLVEVSDIQTVHLPNRAPTVSRHIVLRDLSYSEIKITLWGHRATEFTTEGVYSSDDAKPVIVLFVGGLLKSYQGNYYLSENTACRWYFNPDIPEAGPLYDSYRDQRLEIRSVASPVQQRVQNQPPAQLDEKNLRQLNDISPYDFAEHGYRCTVTIGRLVPNTSWWFPSCNKCSKSCVPDGAGYKCIPCSNNSFKFKYKVCFIALDGTDEAEMICFGDIARRIIGKPVQQLLRTSPGPNTYPADITKLVSLRFTFAVTMTRQSYYRAQKTYNISALVTAHGHHAATPPNAARANAGKTAYEDASAAESGDSSDKNSSENTLEPATPLTPASTLCSPGLSKSAPVSLNVLETPQSKKHGRSGPSKGSKTPSSRRKLILTDDNEAMNASLGAPTSSTTDEDHQASDPEDSSPGQSPAPESG